MTWELFINIFASFLWFIIGLFGTGVWNFIRILFPISKIFGKISFHQEKVVIVIPSFYANVRNLFKSIQNQQQMILWSHGLPLYSEGDSSCLMFVYSTLLKAGKNYSNIEIKSDTEITGDDLRENLICIGAGSNDIARNFLEELDYSVNFEHTPTTFGTALLDQHNNQRYTATTQNDYSIILKTTNPNNAEKDIIIFAGLGPTGTKGAGYFLYRDWKVISRKLPFRRRENFILLLQVDQNDFTNINDLEFTRDMVVQ